MINYYFDNTNKFRPYTHSLEANDDTLPPDNALRIAPEEKDGFIPCEKDGKWIQVEDNREKTAYNIETKEAVEIDYIGQIKEGFTLLEPFEFCKWEDNKWILDEAAKKSATIQQNIRTRDNYIADATAKIDILIKVITDAAELDMSVSDIESQLKNWKKYRILLTLLDTSDINVVFPSKPE